MSATPRLVRVAAALAVAAGGLVLGVAPAAARECKQLSQSSLDPRGLDGWDELLRCYGHSVTTTKTPPTIPNRATVFVTAPDDTINQTTIDALRRTVNTGGRVVVVGPPSQWAKQLTPSPPRPAGDSGTNWDRNRESALTSGVERVTSAGLGAFRSAEDTLLKDGSALALLVEAPDQRGRLVFLADVSVFDNTRLVQNDNAQLAINLAGPEGRPVIIYAPTPLGATPNGGISIRPGSERAQPNGGRQGGGGGQQGGSGGQNGGGGAPQQKQPPSGLDPLPFGWKFALIGVALAILLYAIARAKRNGPPERADRPLPPRRVAFVDALGESLARSRDPVGVGTTLQTRARARIRSLGGLPDDAPESEFDRVAREVGLNDIDIATLRQPTTTDDAVVRTAQVVARLEGNPT